MTKAAVRVRFAPSPTGFMHLGNVRTALMNYLFAKKKNGAFILRIEDTDPQRNFDVGARQIIADLQWLHLTYNEGPIIGGPHEPYFQSERTPIYQRYIDQLIEKNLIYRCFCTPEELEKKRQRQAALKLAPRYDRTCLKYSQIEIQERLDKKIPFIWRVKLDQESSVSIQDLAHGTITFDFKNFSDFPITRADGSVTFIFANFVDDMVMDITHVIRGEDHLTNTANQVALYSIFKVTVPLFWHLPILCNIEGKKLSKRDFGFSLGDLNKAGYLPEAIDNYLAIIGGKSFAQEIMNLDELADAIDFDNMHSTGQVRYDVEKLRWINHKWIARLESSDLLQRVLPQLQERYPQIATIDQKTLAAALEIIKPELYTLNDAVDSLQFLFEPPLLDSLLLEPEHKEIALIVKEELSQLYDPQTFVKIVKEKAQQKNISLKIVFSFLRKALTGKENGPAIHEIIIMLGAQEAQNRFEKIL